MHVREQLAADEAGDRDRAATYDALISETIAGIREDGAEEDRVLRRLEALTTEELTREAIAATRASSRAAWATFWVALFAMIASTFATIAAAYIATR